MTAGIKTLEILDRPGSYEYLDKITNRCEKSGLGV
jgi:glutamate-1-semialdehyde 2,1-aminomutase